MFNMKCITLNALLLKFVNLNYVIMHVKRSARLVLVTRMYCIIVEIIEKLYIQFWFNLIISFVFSVFIYKKLEQN